LRPSAPSRSPSRRLEPAGAELARLKEIYFARFADGPARRKWAGITYIRVRPRWLRYSDYNARCA
jgi:hypothetical protein